MTALNDILIRHLRSQGPMTIAEYMALCLTHPKHGYYMRGDPFGRSGDFITAPEISQMFGELIGLALGQYWLALGRPAPFVLAELGPGRGTLMADALRAANRIPGFRDALHLYLVEASPFLRTEQAKRLADSAPVWIDAIDSIPGQPLFLIANEFFDALPIRQFLRADSGWAERVIGLDDAGKLAFGLAPPTRFSDLEPQFAISAPGSMLEVCTAATLLTSEIGIHIARHGGLALIIDYGKDGSGADTFQAVHAHEKVDPLAAPGKADLTAHVDFAALAGAVPTGAASWPLTPQGTFLERLGIALRAQALANGLSGDRLAAHIAAHRRLTHPEEMGTLFKVLAVTQDGAPTPPGIDP